MGRIHRKPRAIWLRISLVIFGMVGESSTALAILSGFVADAARLPISTRVVHVGVVGTPCTGTLLNERIVITAAHCLNISPTIDEGFLPHLPKEGQKPDGILGGVAVTDRKSFASTVTDGILLRSQFPNGEWTDYKEGERGDLLLLFLDREAIISPTSHFDLDSQKSTLESADLFVAFGFGVNEKDDDILKGRAFHQRPSFALGGESGNTVDTFSLKNPTNGSLCNGDSGGPMFHRTKDGRWLLVGVYTKMEYHPTWWEQHMGGSPEPFSKDFCKRAQFQFETSVSWHSSWIEKGIRTLYERNGLIPPSPMIR